MLKYYIKTYTTQKYGNSSADNEDSIKISPHINRDDAKRLRCAMSDGATQASFSHLWADLLVNEAVKKTPSRTKLDGIIQSANTYWHKQISTYTLEWYAEEKVRKGAFATLLWISVKKPDIVSNTGGTIKALAVGDSNLFIFREDKLVKSFPVQSSKDFQNNPFLISSVSVKNEHLKENILYYEGPFLLEDELFLATDALAAFLLQQLEIDTTYYKQFRENINSNINPESSFDPWIQSLRDEGQLKNDDTTFAWIRLIQTQDMLVNADSNYSPYST